jgi:hypothetical protein
MLYVRFVGITDWSQYQWLNDRRVTVRNWIEARAVTCDM